MTKYSLLFLATMVFMAGCGQESSIKNSIEAENLRAPRTMKIVLPLTENMISSFDTPIKSVTPFLRGVVTPLMHLGAKMGVGKTKIAMDQPIPEIPTDYLKEVKVNRLFLYIEQTQADMTKEELKEKREEEKKQKKLADREKRKTKKFVGRTLHSIGSFFTGTVDAVGYGAENILDGVMELTGQKPDMDLDFLKELAVTVEPKNISDAKDWMPAVNVESLSKNEEKFFEGLFKKKSKETEEDKKQILVKYKGSKSEDFTRTQEFGQVFIIETDTPDKTRIAIENDALLQTYYTRIHTLNKSLLVELVKDPVVEENFKYVFNQTLAKSIKNIRPCDEKICKDLQVSNVNLIPLMANSNGLRMNILLNVKSVPPSFQIKGFVEFEVTFVPLPE